MMDNDVPFWIQAEVAANKRTRTKAFNDLSATCKNIYHPRLDVDYVVHPTSDAQGTSMDWEELSSTDSVFVESLETEIAVDDVVYVQAVDEEKPNRFQSEDDASESQEYDDCWVAHVLEIRCLRDGSRVGSSAIDSDHVYLRVNWLYRPGDLPEKYRGKQLAAGEVVPSNYMQIIDARTVEGKVGDLKHIDEHNFLSLSGPYEELVWRQTFDYFKDTMSRVRHICICDAAANPDFGPLMCNATGGCGTFLHADCIANFMIVRLYREHVLREGLGNPGSEKSTPVRPPMSMITTARKYFDIDLTSTADQANQSGPLMVKVLRLRDTAGGGRDELKKQFDQPVYCLHCFKHLGQQDGHALLDRNDGVR